MDLSSLEKIRGTKTKGKRIGRGAGSGKGFHTVGKGIKGQKSRSGNSLPFGFEGGQVPLWKKLPKIGGFNNPTKKDIVHVSLAQLNIFKDGSKVTPEMLVEKKVLRKLPKHGVKILANGKLEKKLKLEGFLVSKKAKETLEKVGCTIS